MESQIETSAIGKKNTEFSKADWECQVGQGFDFKQDDQDQLY